jgi:hypothetical protein
MRSRCEMMNGSAAFKSPRTSCWAILSKAASSSLGLVAFRTSRRMPRTLAVASISLVSAAALALRGSVNRATVAPVGNNSRSIWSRFGPNSAQRGRACDVAARHVEARDQATGDRIAPDAKDNWDCLGRCLRGKRHCGTAHCCEHSDAQIDQIVEDSRQPLIPPLDPATQRYSIATLRPSTKPVSASPLSTDARARSSPKAPTPPSP